MKSMMICEGRTDFLFLQYFMKCVNSWVDGKGYYPYEEFLEANHKFIKGDHELVIGYSGGCSKMPKSLDKMIAINNASGMNDKKYDHIIIITDRDEDQSEENMRVLLRNEIKKYTNENCLLLNNEWNEVSFTDLLGREYTSKFLFLVIPPDNLGALETFILNSVSQNDMYDKEIIEKGYHFIQQIDPEKRYIKKRRDFVKSQFNTYLSVRIPEFDYGKLHEIFKNFPWDKHEYIHRALEKLSDIENS